MNEQRTCNLGCVNNPDIQLVHTRYSDMDVRITSPEWARGWEDLTDEERSILTALTVIDTLELVDKWVDDHVACWGLRINGIGIGLWWYDDYLGREEDMQDPEVVFGYLEDIRTREYD